MVVHGGERQEGLAKRLAKFPLRDQAPEDDNGSMGTAGIAFSETIDGIRADHLTGFFVGWSQRPSAELIFQYFAAAIEW